MENRSVCKQLEGIIWAGEGASLPRSSANHFVFSSALKNTEVFNALSVIGEWKCSFLRLRFVHELLIREPLFSTLDVNYD